MPTRIAVISDAIKWIFNMLYHHADREGEKFTERERERGRERETERQRHRQIKREKMCQTMFDVLKWYLYTCTCISTACYIS